MVGLDGVQVLQNDPHYRRSLDYFVGGSLRFVGAGFEHRVQRQNYDGSGQTDTSVGVEAGVRRGGVSAGASFYRRNSTYGSSRNGTGVEVGFSNRGLTVGAAYFNNKDLVTPKDDVRVEIEVGSDGMFSVSAGFPLSRTSSVDTLTRNETPRLDGGFKQYGPISLLQFKVDLGNERTEGGHILWRSNQRIWGQRLNDLKVQGGQVNALVNVNQREGISEVGIVGVGVGGVGVGIPTIRVVDAPAVIRLRDTENVAIQTYDIANVRNESISRMRGVAPQDELLKMIAKDFAMSPGSLVLPPVEGAIYVVPVAALSSSFDSKDTKLRFAMVEKQYGIKPPLDRDVESLKKYQDEVLNKATEQFLMTNKIDLREITPEKIAEYKAALKSLVAPPQISSVQEAIKEKRHLDGSSQDMNKFLPFEIGIEPIVSLKEDRMFTAYQLTLRDRKTGKEVSFTLSEKITDLDHSQSGEFQKHINYLRAKMSDPEALGLLYREVGQFVADCKDFDDSVAQLTKKNADGLHPKFKTKIEVIGSDTSEKALENYVEENFKKNWRLQS
jgi:hypothetical protein